MSIISPLPFTFVPNTLILSSQVDADFQHIVDQVNANVPALGGTDFGSGSLRGTTLVSATPTIILAGATVFNDTLSEWGGGGAFTPANTGVYQMEVNGYVLSNAADMTASGLVTLSLRDNGTPVSLAQNQLTWPFSGTVSENFALSLSVCEPVTAGHAMTFLVQVPTFSVGAVEYHGFIAVRRLA